MKAIEVVLHNSMGQCPGFDSMTKHTIKDNCLNVVVPINMTCPKSNFDTSYFNDSIANTTTQNIAGKEHITQYHMRESIF